MSKDLKIYEISSVEFMSNSAYNWIVLIFVYTTLVAYHTPWCPALAILVPRAFLLLWGEKTLGTGLPFGLFVTKQMQRSSIVFSCKSSLFKGSSPRRFVLLIWPNSWSSSALISFFFLALSEHNGTGCVQHILLGISHFLQTVWRWIQGGS